MTAQKSIVMDTVYFILIQTEMRKGDVTAINETTVFIFVCT